MSVRRYGKSLHVSVGFKDKCMMHMVNMDELDDTLPQLKGSSCLSLLGFV